METILYVCRAEGAVEFYVRVYLPRHVVKVVGKAQGHSHVHVSDDVEVRAVVLPEVDPVCDAAREGEPALELAPHLEVGAQAGHRHVLRNLLPRVRVAREQRSLAVLQCEEVHVPALVELHEVLLHGVVARRHVRGGRDLAAPVAVQPERSNRPGPVAQPHRRDLQPGEGLSVDSEAYLADKTDEGDRQLRQGLRRGVALAAPRHRHPAAVESPDEPLLQYIHSDVPEVGFLVHRVQPAHVGDSIDIVRNALREEERDDGRGGDVLRRGQKAVPVEEDVDVLHRGLTRRHRALRPGSVRPPCRGNDLHLHRLIPVLTSGGQVHLVQRARGDGRKRGSHQCNHSFHRYNRVC